MTQVFRFALGNFFWARCADCTEEKLKGLEAELSVVKTFHDENAELMEKVARREDLWSCLLEFEKKRQDPDRFHNRGGNLLREERERKRLEKALPRVSLLLYTSEQSLR